MSIPLCHLNSAVPDQPSNSVEWYAPHRKMAAKGMAQVMNPVVRQPGAPERVCKPMMQIVKCDGIHLTV